MYDEIAELYLEIFPLNRAFLAFIPEFLGKPGRSVLDLGCGPGDYVDHLTRAGYRATGIDNSPGMIAQARANQQGIFYEMSFTEIHQLGSTFDAIYCVGNSLSYLSHQSMAVFLKEVRALLNPAGYFVIQVINWDKYRLTGSMDFPVQKLSDGRTFHRRYEGVDATQVIFHTWIQTGEEIPSRWSAPLYPKYQETLITEVEAARMSIENLFGDYAKSAFDPLSSPALILVAQSQES